MPEYNSIIGAYASIFELSVAMNFAYASSEHFREAMKSGFLHNIRLMEQWYDEKRKEVSSKITLLSDNDIDQASKDNICQKLEDSLEQLKIEDKALKVKIEQSQSKIADETKPIYIYTALFSLIVLFFAGQESAHNHFPIDGLNTLIYLTIIFYIMVQLLKLIGHSISSALSIAFILGTTTCSLFWPIKYNIPLDNKHLLDIAIILAFLPFILSALRLLILTLKIEAVSRINYYIRIREIKEIEEKADNLRDSRDYFKNGL